MNYIKTTKDIIETNHLMSQRRAKIILIVHFSSWSTWELKNRIMPCPH